MWIPCKPTVAENLRSQTTAKWRHSNVNCCNYDCNTGECDWADWNNGGAYSEWHGQEVLGGSGTIGFLLDLDEGTLSVFKNGRRLGVMKDELGGEYVWFVSVYTACTISMSRGRAPN